MTTSRRTISPPVRNRDQRMAGRVTMRSAGGGRIVERASRIVDGLSASPEDGPSGHLVHLEDGERRREDCTIEGGFTCLTSESLRLSRLRRNSCNLLCCVVSVHCGALHSSRLSGLLRCATTLDSSRTL